MPASIRHVVVSPHFDDAVLSCAHALAGPGVSVVTVCAAGPADGTPVSDWDAACGFASGSDAARVRAAEDEAACGEAGVSSVRLPFPDGAYVALPAPAVLQAAVAGALGGEASLWLPAAIGGQPEHRAVRDALLPLVARGRAAGVLYADSPYAAVAGWDVPDAERPEGARWAPALDAVVAAGVRVGDERRVRLVGADLDRKHALVRRHASQLTQLGGVFPGLSHRDGPLATEVWWPLHGRRGGLRSLRFGR